MLQRFGWVEEEHEIILDKEFFKQSMSEKWSSFRKLLMLEDSLDVLVIGAY